MQRQGLVRQCAGVGRGAVARLPALQIPNPRAAAAVRKKVIYLDQYFFSHAFRGSDARFLAVAERIKQLTQSQLLVSPYSSVHEDETHQWRGYKDKTHEQLMEFIKATSRGVQFDPEYRIERSQILTAFQAYQVQGPLEYRLQAREAIRGELDRWDGYFRIDVGGYRKDIELKRRHKGEAVQGLVALLDHWQQSTDTFEQSVVVRRALIASHPRRSRRSSNHLDRAQARAGAR